jgi:hypothetical protein
MSSVENRPYAGTWKLNNRQVVKYTPDALVFLNGDTSLPGCPRCRGRIDIQQYVTSLSVEAGTEPTSHSASIQLTLPRVQGQQLFVDGYNVLRPGLEVNIFMRGYFQVRGLFSHLPDPQEVDAQQGTDISNFPNPTENDRLDLTNYATYPYYPVFHGVVTQVTYDYSDGFYTGTLQCASLLHFWNFQNITTAAAWLALDKKPNNDPGRPTLQGNNLNNMHPFGIIYTLYKDVAGAATGVEYALSEASNLDAVSETAQGAAQLYDQITLYWTQRFKTRIQNLRMYGVNGQLFNSAQQAWLGSAGTRDVDRLLPGSTYNDPTTTNTSKDPTSARWSVAKALGLASAGSDFVYSPLINSEGEQVSLSVLDMFAFSQSIAELGVTNEWTSTYQTKMDVAQQVMEITGYEFYQDVDGDLVFKPPFWNLDTSTNRYYRLEDQDIINISFTEKEPQATFIIVRGTWFKGITDVVSNSNGPTSNRALYIDYKLVAQFGWRPAATLDITYATDPKILFWIAVARLDQVNVDTFSASCTIPIRPELRPGYPVYVPFVDCYYYISQLSHSFAFGGQCTTNLVLTCRRAKFHAPGELKAVDPGQSAIDLIRLDRPDLPPRPLQAYDQGFVFGQGVSQGVPRIVGFPNVVLALDPRKMNPNYTVIGLGVEWFDQTKGDADLLFSLLQRDVDLLDAFEAVGYEVGPDGKQRISDPTQITRFKLRYSSNPDQYVEFDLKKLEGAFADYQRYRSNILALENQVTYQQRAVQQALGLENVYASLDKQGQRGIANRSDVESARSELGRLQSKLESERAALEQARSSEGALEGINLVALIFEALQPTGNKPIRRKVDGIAGSDVTASYFETLSHLKNQYMANSLPGHYRYYSSAHPDEAMQGQPVILFSDGRRPPSGRRRRRRSAPTAASRARTNFAAGRSDEGLIRGTERVSTETSRKARFRDEQAKLQARFDAAGISWTDAGHALRNRNNGYTQNDKLTKEQVKNTPLTDGVSNAIVSIAEAAQVLADRLAARPDFGGRGFSLGTKGSWWRVASIVEGTDEESQHGAGLAIDIGVAGQSTQGFDALKEEAAVLFQEGIVSGLGIYEDRSGGGKPFVHIDLRHLQGESASTWSENSGIKSRRRDASIRIGCAKNSPGNVDACVKAALGARERAKQQLADAIAYAKQRTGSSRRGPNARYPLSPTETVEPQGPAQPPPPPPEPPPEPEPTQELISREVALDTPRKVVQFKKKVSRPESGRLAPEVELGLGNCIRGLSIARGPERTPKVLTTDQIQSVSFIRYESSKFSQVVGVSNTAGSKTFGSNKVFLDVSQKFAEAGQAIQGSGITVADAYQAKYDQIAQDVSQIPIPVFENGEPAEPPGSLTLVPFEDAVTINSELLAPDVQDQIGTSGDISLSGLTFDQLATAQGYASSGPQKDDGQGAQDTINRVADAYSRSVQRQITAAFNAAKAAALEPATDKDERLALISDAFNQIGAAAVGDTSAGAPVESSNVEERAGKEGKIEKPIHAPVFPVSDEKGYQHYGAYRYGRGLSVETGGTFEFIHSGQDPFRNVTAQTAEDFVTALTLVKEGKATALSTELGGIRSAALEAAKERLGSLDILGAAGEIADGVSESVDAVSGQAVQNAEDGSVSNAASAAAASAAASASARPIDQEIAELEQSTKDLVEAVGVLRQTARGRDVLRELLEANGDDPQRVQSDSFQITDTQFARNFANFAVSYAKSPVFKTTVANAAYQLSDLTSHLVPRAGNTCVCRGSYADVVLEAYSRINFVSVDGVDQRDNKATAYQSEEILKKVGDHTLQQQRYRGQIPEGEQPDAKTFDRAEAGGSSAVSVGSPLPQGDRVPSPAESEMVTPENPPTTTDAASGGGGAPPDPAGFGFLNTDEAVALLGEEFDKEAIDLEITGDVPAFVNEVGTIIETVAPLSVLESTFESEGIAGLQRLVDQANAEQPGVEGTEVTAGQRVDVQDIVAYLYLRSSGIQQVPSGTETPTGYPFGEDLG